MKRSAVAAEISIEKVNDKNSENKNYKMQAHTRENVERLI